ncbi:MAG TPA: YgaP-like transmembrane domain [Methylomirabilota bacterium]|nr:YgaP-like transmembrane domain [Methylomirabilota bacterium]
MKPRFTPNISTKGRMVRGLCALSLLVASGAGFPVSPWLGFFLLFSAIFVAFEAIRGWCLLRACGIKTKL